jgi:uncharacterized repeat protein (TIGR01451 family)
MRKQISVLVMLAALLLPMAAVAKPLVSVTITAEKEVSVVTNGQKSVKRIAASRVNPGDVVFYALNYVNSGDETATNVVLDDPIPQGTAYLPGSAFGTGAAVTVSIDGGRTFSTPLLCTYEVKLPNGKVEKRVAAPDEYTNIRWVISKIDASARGTVGFQVRVKR